MIIITNKLIIIKLDFNNFILYEHKLKIKLLSIILIISFIIIWSMLFSRGDSSNLWRIQELNLEIRLAKAMFYLINTNSPIPVPYLGAGLNI